MNINIVISNDKDIPIYEQIMNNIKKAILEDNLREKEMLPSIRELANDLRVSVLTVKKSYDELEKEGYVKVVHGKGCFVMPKNMELLKEEALKKIQNHLEEAVRIANISNIKKEEVIKLMEILYEEEI